MKGMRRSATIILGLLQLSVPVVAFQTRSRRVSLALTGSGEIVPAVAAPLPVGDHVRVDPMFLKAPATRLMRWGLRDEDLLRPDSAAPIPGEAEGKAGPCDTGPGMRCSFVEGETFLAFSRHVTHGDGGVEIGVTELGKLDDGSLRGRYGPVRPERAVGGGRSVAPRELRESSS